MAYEFCPHYSSLGCNNNLLSLSVQYTSSPLDYSHTAAPLILYMVLNFNIFDFKLLYNLKNTNTYATQKNPRVAGVFLFFKRCDFHVNLLTSRGLGAVKHIKFQEYQIILRARSRLSLLSQTIQCQDFFACFFHCLL